MENGKKIKWMDMVLYIINHFKKPMKEIGKMTNFKALVDSLTNIPIL